MEYTAEEDRMILDMVRTNRQPHWKVLAEKMQAMGFDRTPNGLLCRYRLLPKPYEFKAVHKLVQAAICKVRRLAASRCRGSKWQKVNRVRCRAKAKKSRDIHKDEPEYKAHMKEKNFRNRPVSSAREMQRYREDPVFNLTKRLRNRMNDFIKRCKGTNKAASTKTLIGCSSGFLTSRLSSMRDDVDTEHGHIDHIFPFALYDMESKAHQRAVCHYTNIQLLTEEENLEKSNMLPTKAMAEKTLQVNWPPGVKYNDLPDIYDGWSSPLYK